jgi:3-deoxy-manno-octulosonate cytidylyltransferase (CMP-KDO synthetase)
VIFRVVIPARMESNRLPGKVLLDVAGKPMLAHVVDRARESEAEQVWIATDSPAVMQLAEAMGVSAGLTAANHPSGSDRIRELADAQHWPDDTVIVNVQGDEPMLPAALINAVAKRLIEDENADWATVATPVGRASEYFDPNTVKLVLDQAGYAMYFSRAPIPWDRTHSPQRDLPVGLQALRHIGLYAYRAGALRRYCQAPQAELERTESLEQLRALALGMRIAVEISATAPPAGVDTPEDLERLRQTLDPVLQ